MKSHPLHVNTVYELIDKKSGKIINSWGNNKEHEATIEVKIKNPGEDPITLRFPFRSYVSNFSRVLNNAFLNVDNSTSGDAIDKLILTTTGGATYAAAVIHTMAVNEGALSSPTQTNYGIWIGDKDNASGLGLTIEAGVGGFPSYDNYSLRGLILPDGGSPDTDVVYGLNNVLFSNADNTLTVSRRFQNNSGATLYISEIGMVGKSGTDYFLLSRDLVSKGGTGTYDPERDPFTLLTGGTCEVSYIFTVTDSSGWTKNYLRMLSSEFVAGNAVSQVKDITNAAQTINFSSARTQKDLLAALGNSNYGILVGADTAPSAQPSYNTSSYYITDPIAHGTAYGQLSHSVVTPIDLEQGSNMTTFGLQRDFERVFTTGTLYIHSSGLVIRQGTDPYKYFLITYDYVPSYLSELQITPGQILRVKYMFQAPL